ncbi:hypothetical protein AAVH_22797 [Aphelenchoides avenae]|nr:hypothetical protein AAVH_22797 [Aphelenchus avenae]
MLPAQTFADAVAFLRLFDLSPLLVANALCSSLAVEASARIRWEEFPDLAFYVMDRGIAVGKPEGCLPFAGGTLDVVFMLFPTDTEMIDFLAAALPNCIFKDLEIACDNERLLDAIRGAADSVIALRLRAEVTEEEVPEIANFYRGSGLQELQYYSSLNTSPTPTIVALE